MRVVSKKDLLNLAKSYDTLKTEKEKTAFKKAVRVLGIVKEYRKGDKTTRFWLEENNDIGSDLLSFLQYMRFEIKDKLRTLGRGRLISMLKTVSKEREFLEDLMDTSKRILSNAAHPCDLRVNGV